MKSEYGLLATKRQWVPELIWKAFAISGLAVIYPFRWILTKKKKAEDR